MKNIIILVLLFIVLLQSGFFFMSVGHNESRGFDVADHLRASQSLPFVDSFSGQYTDNYDPTFADYITDDMVKGAAPRDLVVSLNNDARVWVSNNNQQIERSTLDMAGVATFSTEGGDKILINVKRQSFLKYCLVDAAGFNNMPEYMAYLSVINIEGTPTWYAGNIELDTRFFAWACRPYNLLNGYYFFRITSLFSPVNTSFWKHKYGDAATQ